MNNFNPYNQNPNNNTQNNANQQANMPNYNQGQGNFNPYQQQQQQQQPNIPIHQQPNFNPNAFNNNQAQLPYNGPINNPYGNKDEIGQTQYNQNGYNEINQDSMADYYSYKASKKKLFLTLGVFSILFTGVLGVFTTPFINGEPIIVNEQQREIVSYSDEIFKNTNKWFKKDSEYFSFAREASLGTVSSSATIDAQLTSEISVMQRFIEQLKTMESSNDVPIGFDGTGGLHQKMIAILELRVARLNDIRVIAQGNASTFNQFQKDWSSYISNRDTVISQYNNKYYANYNKTLYDTKELEFVVQ